ncbi:MAG: hypothetical protein IT225_03380, partial [Flavobacteriales bacterium]|nr:hypothetical protein [Flavobacteriales bacterium]
MSFPFHQQPDHMDCGPTCLRMVARYHGRSVALEEMRKRSETTRSGSNLQAMAEAAETLGFRTLGVKVSLEKVLVEQPFPCVIHWNSSHFVVLHKVSGVRRSLLPLGRRGRGMRVHVADPAHGLLTYTEAEFLEHWIGKGATRESKEGIALLLEPTPAFYAAKDDTTDKSRGFGFLFKYLTPHKKFLFQLVVGLCAASLIQLLIPFLTQSVVDVGIQHRDIRFIWLVLFGQLFLYLGST